MFEVSPSVKNSCVSTKMLEKNCSVGRRNLLLLLLLLLLILLFSPEKNRVGPVCFLFFFFFFFLFFLFFFFCFFFFLQKRTGSGLKFYENTGTCILLRVGAFLFIFAFLLIKNSRIGFLKQGRSG